MGPEPRPVIRRSADRGAVGSRRWILRGASQPEFADEAMIFTAVALSQAGGPERRGYWLARVNSQRRVDLTIRHAVIGTTTPGATVAFRLRPQSGASVSFVVAG